MNIAKMDAERAEGQMNLLFQNRSDVFKNVGGDTVQMLKIWEHLQKEGIQVDISTKLKPKLDKYDIVHLFNTTRIIRNIHTSIKRKNTKTFCNFSYVLGYN